MPTAHTPMQHHRTIRSLLLGALAALALTPLARAQCELHQTTRLLPTGGTCGLSGCRAGFSVAVSADGNTALVGAYGENTFVGAAYIFVRSGSTWTQQGPRLVATGSEGTQPYFGCSAALSADGDTALIGSYGDHSSIGAVYVFKRFNSTWSQLGTKLTPTGTIGNNEYFGFSLSITADGNTAIIGAQGDNAYAGAAYIFNQANGAWTQSAKLVSIGGIGVVQYFGSSVAISADGNTAAVGAYGDSNYLGAAYFFVRTGTLWTLQGPKFIAQEGTGFPLYFGSSVSLSADGNTCLVGSYGDNNFLGAAYIINRYGVIWLEQQKFLPVDHVGAGRYGSSCFLSADGHTAIVGSPEDDSYNGAVYVCTGAGNNWAQPRPKYIAASGVGAGSFGNACALSASGSIAIVGAFTDRAAAGSAVVLDRAPLCPADVNCSGTLEAQDIFDFLANWFTLDPRADFNNSGIIDSQDIFDFLAAWFTGC